MIELVQTFGGMVGAVMVVMIVEQWWRTRLFPDSNYAPNPIWNGKGAGDYKPDSDPPHCQFVIPSSGPSSKNLKHVKKNKNECTQCVNGVGSPTSA